MTYDVSPCFDARSFFALLIGGSIGLLLLMGVANFGLVSGEEFAPDTFERRSYWYYELPLVRIKVTPIKRAGHLNSLQQTLIGSHYLKANTPPRRWDLVAARRRGRLWREGDALILCRYLDAVRYDDSGVSDCYWESWTTEHPHLAKVLWPEVAQLARRDLYFLIPPLFERAVGSDNPQQLRNDLQQLLAGNFELLAETEVALKKLDAAVRFYSDALAHDPERASCLTGRAQCYEALGRTEDARRDRRGVAPAQAEKPAGNLTP